jgi:GH15 family glucan-1,4-alpha-glucosidase
VTSAVLGNGSLLATLSPHGVVERLFWPHVDGGQHLGELRIGIADGAGTLWLDAESLRREQAYVGNGAVVRTVVAGDGIDAEIVDVVHESEPLLARSISIAGERRALVVRCRPELDERPRGIGAYTDPARGALVFYRNGTALALGVSGDAQVACRRLDGDHGRLAHGRVEGTISCDLDARALLACAFGQSPAEALALLDRATAAGGKRLVTERLRYDQARLAQVDAVDGRVGALYRRSLLVLDALADRETGAVIAAPEVDPEFVSSGGYGYVWARDLAYIVLALLAAGRRDLAVGALHWLRRAQSPEGLWAQRHDTGGRLAASWGLHQLDETGAAVFAYEAAWRELGDEQVDAELWPSARRAGELLVRVLDERGLPRSTVDLWEEREGCHAYTAAAAFGGLRAAGAMASRHEPELERPFFEAADAVRAGIERFLWSEEHGRYLRTIPARGEPDLPYPNPGHPCPRDDTTVDVSLLGLAWPFGAVDPCGERMGRTAEAVRAVLACPDGGVLRYAGDGYAGGNSWVLAALWLGLWSRQVGDAAGHGRALTYALDVATPLGLLPEQAGSDGRPAWVLPLAWSHAMLILAVRPELAVIQAVPG